MLWKTVDVPGRHIVALGAGVAGHTLAEKDTAALSDLDHVEAICSELGVEG